MIALAAMQGMGKPGSNIWGTSQGCPADESFLFPGYAEGGIGCDPDKSAAGFRWVNHMFAGRQGATRLTHDSTEGQMISRLRIPEALQHEQMEFRGKGFCGSSIESQFQKYEYPAPGYPYIHMYWRYGGSFFGTMTQTNRYVKAYRNPKLQFAVSQPIWFEGEAKFADIVLPACTNFERWDISEFASCSGYIPDSLHADQQPGLHVCRRSASSRWARASRTTRSSPRSATGWAWATLFTMGGKDEYQWVKEYFHATDLPKYVSWEKFEKKGYFVLPFPKEHKSTPAMRWFAEDRVRDTPDWGPAPADTVGLKGLQTASGKIEFVSHSLTRFEAGGNHRSRAAGHGPAVHPQLGRPPHHRAVREVPAAAGLASPAVQLPHHGRRQGELDERGQGPPGAGRRPLLLDHAPQHPGRGRPRHQERRPHPSLQRPGLGDPGGPGHRAGAPGTVHSYESCAEYDPLGVPGESPDRGGCVNILTNIRLITPYSGGMSNNSCLIQVEKWEGGEMKKWNMVVDVALCHDCNNCFLACKDEYVGNDFKGYSVGPALVRPALDEHRAQGEGPVPHGAGGLPAHALPALRQRLPASTKDGAVYKRKDGLVIIDPKKAKGRKEIVDSCPYGVIYWNEELQASRRSAPAARI